MKIETLNVSGIKESLIAMRNPKESQNDTTFTPSGSYFLGEEDKRLAKVLGQCKPGTGHDSFLKGIIVHADFTMTHDFVLQFYRYSFRDTISSTSKMHTIHKGDITDKCTKWVSPLTIDVVNFLIAIN